MACQVEAGDGGQNFRSGGEYDLTVHSFYAPSLRSQSKCMWAIILRTCLGVLCTLGVRVVLNLLYVKFFRSQLTGDFPSWSLFRPRPLSSAALSILRGANHSYNPSVGEAEMHLASLVESVPLAASGTPVNIGDKGSSPPLGRLCQTWLHPSRLLQMIIIITSINSPNSAKVNGAAGTGTTATLRLNQRGVALTAVHQRNSKNLRLLLLLLF